MSWRSYHLYYHRDRQRALRRMVLPLFAELWLERRIDGFFFLRYSLGGPHLRLRLRVVPGEGRAVDRRVRGRADELLREAPAAERPAAEIERSHRRALADSAWPGEDHVRPNNTFEDSPYVPELERYGGEHRIEAAHDLFTASSALALHRIVELGEAPAARRFGEALRCLWLQAVGLASSSEMLARLLDPAEAASSAPPPLLVRRAEQAWERRGEALAAMTAAAVEEVLVEEASGEADPARALLHDASRRFAAGNRRQATHGGDVRAAHGQLHTTANRLAVRTADEVVARQLLAFAGRRLADRRPTLWQRLERHLIHPERTAGSGLASSSARIDRLFGDLLPDPLLDREIRAGGPPAR